MIWIILYLIPSPIAYLWMKRAYMRWLTNLYDIPWMKHLTPKFSKADALAYAIFSLMWPVSVPVIVPFWNQRSKS